jgi:transcriptional regulator with XRE-family HTH domain
MSKKTYKRFPKYLETLRRARGLSQKVMALRLGISYARWSALESVATEPPSSSLVRKVAFAFPCDDIESRQLQDAARHDRLMRQVQHELDDRHQQQLLELSIDAIQTLSEEDIQVVIQALYPLVNSRNGWNQLAQKVGGLTMT